MSKVIRENNYSVLVDNSPYITGLDLEGALESIRYILSSRGVKDIDTIMDTTKFKVWFNGSHPSGISLRVTKGDKITLNSQFSAGDNKVIASAKLFGGDCLKYNTIEEPAKWQPHRFQSKEVWLAMSATTHKGWSTLGKPKKNKSSNGVIDTLCMEIVPKDKYNLTDYIGGIERDAIALLQSGKTKTEVFKTLRVRKTMSNNQLHKLIGTL
jgi:hypothetical protein